MNTTAGPTGLIVGASSTPSTVGMPVTSGPLGSGTLNLGNNAVLISAGAFTVGNAVSLAGNLTFNGATNNLTLSGPVALPTGGTSTITVAAPQVSLTLSGVISGTGSAINQSGYGTLILGAAPNFGTMSLIGGNTFTGGVTVNNGVLEGLNGAPFGTGPLTINGGQVQLLNNQGGEYPNNVTINSSAAFFNVNTNGTAPTGTNGNIFAFGTLTQSASAVVNVTGGNNSKLAFSGNVNLIGTGVPTYNVAAGVTLILPGGYSDSNRPVISGSGVVAFSGSNNFVTTGGLTIPTGGTGGVAAQANAASAPYGAGNAITLNNNSLLQVSPLPGTLSAAGYTPGGLSGRFYSFTAATYPWLSAVTSSGIGPGAVVGNLPAGDTNVANHPVNIMNSNGVEPQYDIEVYSGLIDIANAGTYNFEQRNDDEGEIVIDSAPIHLIDNNGTTGGFGNGPGLGSIYLTQGYHQITIRHQNGTGGSGIQVEYTGPDTLAAGVPGAGWETIPNSVLYSSTALTGSGGGSGYLNAAQINNSLSVAAGASATVDAGGAEFNSAFAGMTLGASSTLTVNNLEGSGYIGIQGLTTVGSGATVSPNSGMLYMIGGVSDGGLGLVKAGQGTLILGGSGGTFTGPLAVNNGYVQVASANALTSGTTSVNCVTASAGTLTGASETNGSNVITVASTAGLLIGQTITGTGIPANSSIIAVNSATSLTINNNATSTNSGQSFTTSAGTSGATLDLNGTLNVVAGDIILNGSGPLLKATLAPAALYNSSSNLASIAPSTVITIGSATGAISPSIGGYGDINIAGPIQDGTPGLAWSKVGPDTLILSGSNTFTGTLTVSMGVLAIGGSNAFGSTTSGTVSIASGATMDLAGQSITATARALNLVGTGLAGYPQNNALAALINSAGGTTATYAGVINLGGATGIGSNSYNPAAPGGNIVLTGTIGPATAGVGINKVGLNTLTITGSIISTTGGYNLQEGATVLTGPAGQFTAGAPVSLVAGASLTLDDSVYNLNNRLGSAVNGSETFNGNFTIIGNSASTSELIGTNTIKFTNSGPMITLQPDPNGSLLLNITSNTALGYTAGATALFRGNGLGSLPLASLTAGNAGFGDGTQANPGFVGQNTTGTTSQGVLPWALVDSSGTGNGMSLATYTTANGFQALNFSNVTGVTGALTANANVQLTSGAATSGGSGITTINSLTLNGGSVVINAGSTLALQSGGLLAIGSGTLSGPGAMSTSANAPLIIHAPNPDAGGATQLNINAQVLGTTGVVVKADGGLAVFAAQQLYTGQTIINGGTLQLAAGNQTLYAQPAIGTAPGNWSNVTASVPANVISTVINLGGTLDLDGSTQTVTNLTNNGVNAAAMNVGEQPMSGGTVTNSSATTATLSILLAGNNVAFGGSITGNVNLITAGGWTYTLESPNTFTGTTTKQGGNLTLIDLGTLQNTSAVYLNGGTLWWNDTGTQAGIQRLPPSASINLNGGAFNYSARSGEEGTQGSITVGALNLLSGASLVNVVPNNGVATVTFNNSSGTITRNVGATVLFEGTNSNGLGDTAHVYFNTPPATTGGLIGAWATATQMDEGSGGLEPGFATYNAATGGVQNINPNLVTIGTGNVPAGINARMNGNTTLPAGGVTLNTLSLINAAETLSFSASTDQLIVTTGGILGGYDANNKSLGQSANFGQITAGPGQPELFVYCGANTLTVNSSLVDNGVAGGLNVVIGNLSTSVAVGAGGVVTLAGSNSYRGTTYVNGAVNLNAAGGLAVPGNLVAMTESQTTDGASYYITLNQANQISSTGSVTLNGGTVLNLNGFSNTIANLALNNFSGEYQYTSATVLTGMGVLTVTGSVSVANNTDTFFVPVINGLLTLGNAAPTISAAVNQMAPSQVGLQLNAGVTLSAPSARR